MPETIPCPSCGVKLQVPEEDLGTEWKCPKCGSIFRALAFAFRASPAAGAETEDQEGRNIWTALHAGLPKMDERPHLLRQSLSGIDQARSTIILLIFFIAVETFRLILAGWVYWNEPPNGNGIALAQWPLKLNGGPQPVEVDFQVMATMENQDLLQTGFFIVTAVAFLMWIFQAYRNLAVLGVYGQYSATEAVGYFFIPIFNLVRPIQVVQEIWRESDPSPAYSGDFPTRKPGRLSALAGFWWAFWLLGLILGNIGLFQNPTPPWGILGTMISMAAMIISGILLIFLIRTIMNRQMKKYRLLADRSKGVRESF